MYVLLFGRYRAYEIDNPWYLSFSRNSWVDNFHGDAFLNGIFPDGMGGTAVFGRGPALVQGAVLNPLGWSPFAAMLFSTLVVLAGLTFWYKFLMQSGLSTPQSHACILALGLSETFVGMANRFRYEPYSFLMMALAFWLASCRRPWLALVVSLLALEVQPAAGMVFLSLSLFLLRSKWPVRTLIPGFVLAAIVFALMYGILHPHIVETLRATDWRRGADQREAGGFLRSYFIDRQRHLIELILFSACAVALVWRYKQAPIFVRQMSEVSLLVSACSFLMRWPTPAYMVFWYPAALVVAVWCLSLTRLKPWALPAIMALIMLPQYGVVAWINRDDGYSASDIARVKQTILNAERDAGLDDTRTQIMGDYSLWFAHPARYRALARTTLGSLPGQDLFLCFNQPLRPWAMVDPLVRYCADVETTIPTREVNRLMVRGHLLRFLLPFKPSPTPP